VRSIALAALLSLGCSTTPDDLSLEVGVSRTADGVGISVTMLDGDDEVTDATATWDGHPLRRGVLGVNDYQNDPHHFWSATLPASDITSGVLEISVGGERASIVVRPPEPLTFSPTPAETIAHADTIELTWSPPIPEPKFYQVNVSIPCRSYVVATTHYARVLLRAYPGASASTGCTASVHLNVSGSYELPNGPFARVRGTQHHDVTTTFGLVAP
jgi:hypothetical protein